MVETTSAAKAMKGGEDDRGETPREHLNERVVGFDTRITYDIKIDDGVLTK